MSLPGSYNPSQGQPVTKTIVIAPGEKVILPKRTVITRTIIEGDAAAETACENFLTNIISEDRVKYAFYLEFNNDVSKEETIDGINVGGVNYPFAAPFSIHADLRDFHGTGTTGETVIVGGVTLTFVAGQVVPDGVINLYRLIEGVVPDTDVLFKIVKVERDFWEGPTGDSDLDNLNSYMLTFASFPSIVGDDLDKIYLYGTGKANSGFPSHPGSIRLRWYPVNVDQ